MKAKQLSDIPHVASPKPLDAATWGMWVDTEQSRGNNAVVKLVMRMRDAHGRPDAMKALFTGHAGSGKSTELQRVAEMLKDLYHCVIGPIGTRYALPQIDYRQFLFYCATQLVDVAEDQKATLSRDEAKALLEWFDETTKEEVRKDGYNLDAGAGVNLSLFKSLFAKVAGKIYSGGETKEKTVKHIESRLDQLRLNMQVMVKAIEEKLAPGKLLLIVEDLDKIEDLEQGRRLFFEHRRQLLDVPCSMILTFPIALWYGQDDGVLNYPIRYLLPMIPVDSPPETIKDLNPQKAERGRAVLRKIVFARLDETDDLISEEALEKLIDDSGGVLRDLLYVLREAAVSAQVAGRTRIEIGDIEGVGRELRSEYANRLGRPASTQVTEDTTASDPIKRVLGETEDWPKESAIAEEDVGTSADFKRLLQSLCILEYDGDRWYDLHPLVRAHLNERKKLLAARARAARRAEAAEPTQTDPPST